MTPNRRQAKRARVIAAIAAFVLGAGLVASTVAAVSHKDTPKTEVLGEAIESTPTTIAITSTTTKPIGATSTTASTERTCAGTVGEPQSDILAKDIHATNLTCAAAIQTVKSIRAGNTQAAGKRSWRAGEYTCVAGTTVDKETIPSTPVTCTKGNQRIRYVDVGLEVQ